MSRAIVDIISGSDRAVEITNDEGKRTLSFGANWNTIIVGMNIQVSAAATWPMDAGGFGIGLMSGTTNGRYAATPGHWVGLTSWGGNNINTPTNGFRSNDTYVYRQQNGTPDASSDFGYATISGVGRTFFGFVAVRGTPTSIYPLWTGYNGDVGDIDDATFWEALESLSYTNARGVLGSTLYAAATPHTLTLDEATYGDLDSVSVFWPQVTQKLRVAAIGAAKWT